MKQMLMIVTVISGLISPLWGDNLEKSFREPADSAKPRTYWFHMSGNITKPGITADLEAMKAIGLGGTLFMNVSVAIPEGLVENKDFMSPAWQDCFQHMLNESARLGLDFGSAVCDGWGNAGGPAITPDLAMQRLTWSETHVRGGEAIEVAKLPQPVSQLDYYRDIAVLAFPTPPDEQGVPPLPAKKRFIVRGTAASGPEARFDFDAPVAVRELTLTGVGMKHGNSTARIEASDDGTTWREVKKFPTAGWHGYTQAGLTVAFNPTTARHFRVQVNFLAEESKIAEATLSAKARINYWQAKSAITFHNEHGGGAEYFLDAGAADVSGIPLVSVINLTGRDKWIVPAGDWTVLRVGHTPTGAHNAPATKAGVGLECDKFNPRGIEAQQAAFVDKMLAATSPAGKRAYKHTWIDSWEVGPQNWTANFAAEFKARHGYDLTPWLPVLAGGRIIGSRDQSERVLWDFRRTIADLIVDNYWKHSMELAHQRGIEFRAESFGRQQFMYDPMNYARACDMPCGEFWIGGGPRVDCKVAASAAHLSGRQISGAESFTEGRGQWLDSPWSLKTLGDRAFCLGVNQYYIHRYAHQPWTNLVPGMTFGPYGINFERTSTWWQPGKAWVTYLTRCMSLLQQGRFVADALVMLDEGAPSYGGWRDELAIPLPAGYDYDFANLKALQESKVVDGVIVHQNGMRYRVLILPATGHATLALMREVLRLAEAGAMIAAPHEFIHSCGLTADEEVMGLWVKAKGTGNVILASTFDAVAKKAALVPDFTHDSDAELLWIHRTDDAGTDWYFVSNQSEMAADICCTFRVAGRQPELWDAATGQTRDAARFEERGGFTTVQIPFDPRGSWFVVFRKPASPLAVKPEVAKAGIMRLLPENPAITNNFTLIFRAKPAADIELLPVANQGIHNLRKQNFAVMPKQGELMFGPGHVNMGVSIGRNGIALVEHGARYNPARIVTPQHITNWIQVAVVYHDRKPTLYVDGKVVGSAGASAFLVHPGCLDGFKGELADIELINTALDADQVAAHVASKDNVALPTAMWIENGHLVVEKELPDTVKLDDDWQVNFQPGRGAPASIHLEHLMDLSRHTIEGVRFFSGTANYRKTVQLSPAQIQNSKAKIYLDLGLVHNLAEVIVNGHNLGVLWKEPFRADVTDALKAGANEIEIRVTNLWVNRLIGDAKKMAALGVSYNKRGTIAKWPAWVPQDAPPAEAPATFATWRQWEGKEALPSSGLIGPVTLRTMEQVFQGLEK